MWYRFAKNTIIAGKKEVLQILGNDLEKLKQIESVMPKFQMAAAYFLTNGVDEKQIKNYFSKLENIEKYRPINIQYTKKGILINQELYHASNWLSLTEKIDAMLSAVNESQKTREQKQKEKEIQKQSEDKIPLQNGTVNVVKINNVNDAIKYGTGMSWCISQPGNSMWQSYRDIQDSSFYFIYDGTRPEGDPLRRVALDVNKNGILLTDINNTTGNISEFGQNVETYLQYLKNKGVNTSQFVNNPRTPEEIEESKVLSRGIYDLQRFIQLPQKYPNISNIYSKYIGRGHSLRSEQLEWLLSNNLNHLVNQYVNTGQDSVEQQKKYFINNPKFKNTFYRMIDIKSGAMAEQIKEGNINNYDSLGGEDCIRKLVEKGVDPNEICQFFNDVKEDEYGRVWKEERELDPLSNNFELIQYLIDHGAGGSDAIDLLPWKESHNIEVLKKIWYNSKSKQIIGYRLINLLPINDPMMKEIVEKTDSDNIMTNLLFNKEIYSNPELLRWVIERAIKLKNTRALNAAMSNGNKEFPIGDSGEYVTIPEFINSRDRRNENIVNNNAVMTPQIADLEQNKVEAKIGRIFKK